MTKLTDLKAKKTKVKVIEFFPVPFLPLDKDGLVVIDAFELLKEWNKLKKGDKMTIKENLMLTQALNKLERKHKRELVAEYERGWNAAMVCKKGTKRLCSECKKKLVNNS
jgi:uncharacterized protein (DUF488 family)